MKRVAIPMIMGKMSEHFGKCSYYEIFDIAEGKISSENVEIPPDRELEKLPEWAAELGITDIIAYKVDKKIIRIFSEYKINLYLGIPANDTEKILEDYLNGSLKSDVNIVNTIIE